VQEVTADGLVDELAKVFASLPLWFSSKTGILEEIAQKYISNTIAFQHSFDSFENYSLRYRMSFMQIMPNLHTVYLCLWIELRSRITL